MIKIFEIETGETSYGAGTARLILPENRGWEFTRPHRAEALEAALNELSEEAAHKRIVSILKATNDDCRLWVITEE